MTNPDGSFAGVVVSSLDVAELEKFFSSLDLGQSGIVSLVGTDGILLARGGPDPASRGLAGISVANSPLFSQSGAKPSRDLLEQFGKHGQGSTASAG